MRHAFVYVGDDFSNCPRIIGQTASRNLPRALVLKADKVFGPGNYRLIPDATLTGCYARTADGRCLSIEPK